MSGKVNGKTYLTDQLYLAAYLKACGAQFIETREGRMGPKGIFVDFVFQNNRNLKVMEYEYKENRWFEEVGPQDFVSELMFMKREIIEFNKSKENPYWDERR